ncbi:aminodeoxychorismate lyase [Bifidobacterium gallicum]|uniref:4-amino-4-deoxychorismate lyase n=1 Tax=Bifidobacterium gallicum DSM 20093 = LMG 11596 TaxID=561180 RepID=D1NWW6_9BIFI|nr:aminodeoxychorismate lyase [Bifidobacterium gallicum]EFA22097.1 aminotransferase, class IV [Bifidobacterium gallicum DSM 20093 = LMG 11596]KFI59035.1 4-amino-4-deoxychorismate lyase [Bifidobacterium gallicum DSM 20093 = LMG 11596]
MNSIVLAMGNGKAMFGDEKVSDSELLTFVDPHGANINAFDLSVLRGDGIFEATTVWKGYPVSLENHLRRLANSAAMMDMPTPNMDALTRGVEQVIEQYDDPEPGPLLRIIVSRGLDEGTGVGKAAQRVPTVFMFLDAKGTLHETDPISMASMTRGYPSDITSRAPWLLNGAKTLSYAFNCAVHRECDRRGVGDAVLYTEDGYTMECPNSSIVARYGDMFVTPDPSIGILHGTSQRELFAWAQQEGKKITYRKLPIEELRDADRLYMAHGGWVIPVNELDERSYDYDAAEIEAMNDAIHTGRTHDDALNIAPSMAA